MINKKRLDEDENKQLKKNCLSNSNINNLRKFEKTFKLLVNLK